MSLVFNFPGGTWKTVTIAATAGNVVTNKSPGPGKRWIILGGRITIVCDVNAASRLIRLQLTNGTAIFNGGVQQATAYTAGQTRSITFSAIKGEDAGYDEAIFDSALLKIGGILSGAGQFRITIGNGLAGDSYSGVLMVMEVGITP